MSTSWPSNPRAMELAEELFMSELLAPFSRRGPPGFVSAQSGNALLWYDATGILRACALRLPNRIYPIVKGPWTYTLWIEPSSRGRGVGMLMVHEADRRWKIDFADQKYAPQAAALVYRYLQRQGRPIPEVVRRTLREYQDYTERERR